MPTPNPATVTSPVAYEVLGDTVYYPSLSVYMEIVFQESFVFPQKLFTAIDYNALSPQQQGSAAPAGGPDLTKPTNRSKGCFIVPKQATIELNGYRTAGKFELLFEYKDFPLDPRIVRSVYVQIHLGAVTDDDFASGMEGGFPSKTGKPNPPRKSQLTPTDATRLITGIVDSIDIQQDDNGIFVRLEGRDSRGPLIDTALPSGLIEKINGNQPIDQVVKDVLKFMPTFGNLTVMAAAAEQWPNQIVPSPHELSANNPGSVNNGQNQVRNPRHQFAAKDNSMTGKRKFATKASPGQGQGASNQLSVWDFITQCSYLCGAIPHMQGEIITIIPAQSVFAVKVAEAAANMSNATANYNPNDLPFGNGTLGQRSVPSGTLTKPETITFRKFTIGKDVQSFKMERQLRGQTKVPAVRVVSYDPSRKGKDMFGNTLKRIEAYWPKSADPKNNQAANPAAGPSDPTDKIQSNIAPGGAAGQIQILTFPIPDVNNIDQLTNIAHALYEEIGRQEIGGSVSTKNLASLGGDNQDPDILRLKPGDPIEIRVNASAFHVYPPPVSELTNEAGREVDEQVAELTRRIGDPALAAALVLTARGRVAGLTRVFRTSNVKYTWDAESGIAIDFNFQNYVEVTPKTAQQAGEPAVNQVNRLNKPSTSTTPGVVLA